MKRLLIALSLLALFLVLPLVALGDVGVGPGGGTPGTSLNFQLVGHNDLSGHELDGNTIPRGMNSQVTIYGHYAYIGNRTDGSSTCGFGDPRGYLTQNCPHPHPGILIADIADPQRPTVVGEIGPPHAGQIGITTRELRVWPQQKLLIVMTFRCSSQIHACPPGNDTTFPFDLKFFDLADPVHPRFISSYVPTSMAGVQVKPHEMYLWVDPRDPGRALLWLSTPTLSVNPNRPNLMIVDISQVPSGGPPVGIAEGNWNQLFPGAEVPANYDADLDLHSMAPTADGRTTYLAYLRGGMGVLDTSQVAAHTAVGCSESHSAVPVPGRPFELSTDEVYGTFTVPSFGWPWGWARLINVANPARPHLLGEYKIFQNTQTFQGSPGDDLATEQFTSYSSHNPTVLRDLAFIAWHSGGLQAIDISDPGDATQAGWFSPGPLSSVATEDPALNGGPNKVTVWSYPIISNGLIYVIDIRNGLYILRYTGTDASDVAGIRFLEGNSNLGDAVRLTRNHQ